MTRTEYLLACLAEECSEVAKAAMKAQRFGVADGYPGTDRTNGGDIAKELNELLAIVEMLREICPIPMRDLAFDVEVKRVRTEHYLRWKTEDK